MRSSAGPRITCHASAQATTTIDAANAVRSGMPPAEWIP